MKTLEEREKKIYTPSKSYLRLKRRKKQLKWIYRYKMKGFNTIDIGFKLKMNTATVKTYIQQFRKEGANFPKMSNSRCEVSNSTLMKEIIKRESK